MRSIVANDKILDMKGVSKSFGAVRALRRVDLDLRRGEVLALLGENGAGKSTLMNVLSGGFHSYEGQIFIEGRPVQIHSPTAAHQYGIVKIHQELQLIPELTVAENIFLGRESRTRTGVIHYAWMNREARTYMDILDLKVEPNVQVKKLKVGEQQLVEIAKALSLNAKLVIMDEPTTALSTNETARLFEVVRKLAQEGVSIIYITHRMEEIFKISDRIIVLRDGANAGQVDTSNTDHDELVRMMVGRTFQELFPNRQYTEEKPLLNVQGLSLRSDKGRRKLNDLSFTLHAGEILGISGLLGSGRSELLECIFGMHFGSTSGMFQVEGLPAVIKHPQDAIDNGIAFVTEDRKAQGLVLGRSIGENMSLPILKKLSRYWIMETGRERNLWQEQMTALDVKAFGPSMAVGHLSGGNQQKVVMAKWLLTHPKILLLDEPTRGIDVNAKAEIYQLIQRLAKEGMGILLVSSDMPEILGLCDRILTMCEGTITAEFRREEASEEKLLKAATRREVG